MRDNIINKECNELLTSLGFDEYGVDAAYFHILEVVGAFIRLDFDANNTIDNVKRRVFWKTLQQIATHEIEKSNNKYVDESPVANGPSLRMVLTAFPDKKKLSDGRMWLPLHLAVSLPNVDSMDVQLLLESEPQNIELCIDNEKKYNPCHLAVIVENPDIVLINRLKYSQYGSSLTSQKDTPLHLAAQFSNSVALIKELVEAYPKALTMKNIEGNTPICCVSDNLNPSAPELLQALIEIAPHTATQLDRRGTPPLHRFLESSNRDLGVDNQATTRMITMLLNAYPDAVNIPDQNNWLPVHLAARWSGIQVFKIVTDANRENLLPMEYGSVAHHAAMGKRLETLRYIHSTMPKLLLAVRGYHRTPLFDAVLHHGSTDAAYVKSVAALAPDAEKIVDINGNNLLHALVDCYSLIKCRNEEPLLETFRFLLRLIPGGALATNDEGKTPYDYLCPNERRYGCVRRLLLLAGAPSLQPEVRRQMNYAARRGALFAFFSSATKANIFLRIRHGPARAELIRHIVCFL